MTVNSGRLGRRKPRASSSPREKSRHERAQKRNCPHRPPAPPRRKTGHRQPPGGRDGQPSAKTPANRDRRTADHALASESRHAGHPGRYHATGTAQTVCHAVHAQARDDRHSSGPGHAKTARCTCRTHRRAPASQAVGNWTCCRAQATGTGRAETPGSRGPIRSCRTQARFSPPPVRALDFRRGHASQAGIRGTQTCGCGSCRA